MNQRYASLALCSFVVATLWPTLVRAGETTTSAGVQVIQMGDPTPGPQRPTPGPQKPKPRRSAAQASSQPTQASPQAALTGADTLLRNALALLGAPYVMGGTTPRGFDCSGYVQYAFATIGIRIPRTADTQFYEGRPIAGDPLPGDLVFFQTYEYGPSHVGIYLGGGHFVNAIGKDVHIAGFDSTYFRGRYLGARRYLPD